uniref:Uncharacterized protein n=1 Tax=Rhizophora mucronata TaxID=61149 RepID=A0A2P2KJH5_RHIMU
MHHSSFYFIAKFYKLLSGTGTVGATGHVCCGWWFSVMPILVRFHQVMLIQF